MPYSIAEDLLAAIGDPGDAGAWVLETILKDAGFEVHRAHLSRTGTRRYRQLYARHRATVLRPYHLCRAYDVCRRAMRGRREPWRLSPADVKDGFLLDAAPSTIEAGHAAAIALLRIISTPMVASWPKMARLLPYSPPFFPSRLITGDEEDLSRPTDRSNGCDGSRRARDIRPLRACEPAISKTLGDCIKVGTAAVRWSGRLVDGSRPRRTSAEPSRIPAGQRRCRLALSGDRSIRPAQSRLEHEFTLRRMSANTATM